MGLNRDVPPYVGREVQTEVGKMTRRKKEVIQSESYQCGESGDSVSDGRTEYTIIN